MGCDIHASVIVHNHSDCKFYRCTVGSIAMINDEISFKHCNIAPFRNYTVFGLLTDGLIRSSGLYDNINHVKLTLPCKGRFKFTDINWGIHSCKSIDDVTKYIESNPAAKVCYDSQLIDYYKDQCYHTHTYFTVHDLKELLKNLKRYKLSLSNQSCSIDTHYVDFDRQESIFEVDNCIQSIKMIIDNAKSVVKFANLPLNATNRDIVVICAFDS